MGSQRLPTQQIARLKGHTGPVQALTFSSGSGQYLLSGSSDRTINLYNPSKSEASALIQTYTGAHGHSVLSISVSADNARFASGGGERAAEIFLWDVAAARTLRRYGDHNGRVEAVAFAGDSDGVLVTGGFDAAVRIWDCRSQSGKPMMILKDAKDCITSVLTSDVEIIAGGVDGRIRRYDVRMGAIYVDVVGSPVSSIAITQQADSILASTLDSTIRLLDRVNGNLLQQFTDPEFRSSDYKVKSTMAANDSLVVSGSEDGHVYVWSTVSAERVQRIRHLDEGVTSQRSSLKVVSAVACRKGSSQWASAGGDGVVRVWG